MGDIVMAICGDSFWKSTAAGKSPRNRGLTGNSAINHGCVQQATFDYQRVPCGFMTTTTLTVGTLW